MTFEDLLSQQTFATRDDEVFGSQAKVRKMLDSNGNLPKRIQPVIKDATMSKAEWDPDVKQRVLRKIQPDTQQMLAYMGKPLDFWKL